jgi:hypothetical protein
VKWQKDPDVDDSAMCRSYFSKDLNENGVDQSTTFEIRRFDEKGGEISNHTVRWAASIDQIEALNLFATTLGESKVKGYCNRNNSLEYILVLAEKICSIIDPSHLKKAIKLYQESEEKDHDEDEDMANYSDPEVLKARVYEDIQGASDPVLFDFGGTEDPKSKKKTTRVRNALSSSSQVSRVFSRKYGFESFGPHVDYDYAHKHFQTKFQTEIKSFVKLNSPRWFVT